MSNNSTYQHNGNCDIPCDEYFYTECIIHNHELVFLGLETGASTKEIIEKLQDVLQYQKSLINSLNNQVSSLNEQISTLNGQVDFTPIEENQYGTHPAFETQSDYNTYVLSNMGTTTSPDEPQDPEPDEPQDPNSPTSVTVTSITDDTIDYEVQ